jgi:hypothetical protein
MIEVRHEQERQRSRAPASCMQCNLGHENWLTFSGRHMSVPHSERPHLMNVCAVAQRGHTCRHAASVTLDAAPDAAPARSCGEPPRPPATTSTRFPLQTCPALRRGAPPHTAVEEIVITDPSPAGGFEMGNRWRAHASMCGLPVLSRSASAAAESRQGRLGARAALVFAALLAMTGGAGSAELELSAAAIRGDAPGLKSCAAQCGPVRHITAHNINDEAHISTGRYMRLLTLMTVPQVPHCNLRFGMLGPP